MGRIGGILVFLAAVAGLGTPVAARDALGIFGSWGAFRDARPLRCFAIAEPQRKFRDATFRPFAAVATWPGRGTRGQLHIRMRKSRQADAPITLSIGERRYPLVGGGADAWAPDPRTDAAIVTAMRSGTNMHISTRAENGRRFADTYGLRGAATAIDAAALGCARIR